MNMRTPPSLLNEDDDPNIIMNMAPPDVDFSEYEWMAEDLDEFDRQVEEELQEQEMIEQCFEDLYEMERLASEILSSSPVENALISFEPSSVSGSRTNGMVHARQDPHSFSSVQVEEPVRISSKLNPLAPEFKPKGQC